MQALPTLEDATVRLRPVRIEDAGDLLAHLEADGTSAFSLGVDGRTLPHVQARLAEFAVADPAWIGVWAVTAAASDAPLGLVMYGDRHLKHDRATIAYFLAPHARRGGLMRAAAALALTHLFEAGLHRIEAEVEPGNRPSRALLTRLGFRRESALLRDRVVVEGMRRSVLLYALTSPDWWSLRSLGLQKGDPCAG